MRPGWETPLRGRTVPPPEKRPDFFAHPRLRRAGTITQHTVAASLEALGADAALVQSGKLRLGIVACTMSGSVRIHEGFTRRSCANRRLQPADLSGNGLQRPGQPPRRVSQHQWNRLQRSWVTAEPFLQGLTMQPTGFE